MESYGALNPLFSTQTLHVRLKVLKQSEWRTFIYLDLDLKPWSKLAFTVRATQSVPQFESFQKSSSVVRYSYIIVLMASLKFCGVLFL